MEAQHQAIFGTKAHAWIEAHLTNADGISKHSASEEDLIYGVGDVEALLAGICSNHLNHCPYRVSQGHLQMAKPQLQQVLPRQILSAMTPS